MGRLEIERKFLVKQGVDLGEVKRKYETVDYIQAYLVTGDLECRIRQEGNKYFITAKQNKSADCLVRGEMKSEITRQEFLDKLRDIKGKTVEKTRTYIQLGDGLRAELDIFKGELTGLALVEVEFPNEARARSFMPPEWFGEDVTGLKEYRNQSLAMRITPKGATGYSWYHKPCLTETD